MDDLSSPVYLVGALGPPQAVEGEDPDRRFCVVQQAGTVHGFAEERYEVLRRLRHGVSVRDLLALLGPTGREQLAEMVERRLVVVAPLEHPEVLDELFLVSVLTDLGPHLGSDLVRSVRFADGSEGRLTVHTLALVQEGDTGRTLGESLALAEELGVDRTLLTAMLNSDLNTLFWQGNAMFDWAAETA
ncbi:hypothetical protein NUM3379_01490 [Kineococcus sp. NUM-3379]